MNIKVIVLDFDGVIVESTEIKTEAFRDVFADYPEHFEAIVRHHKENEGISRYGKFRFIHEELIGKTYDQEVEKELDRQFKQRVLERIKKCPFVKGAVEFLENYHDRYSLYVVSGTPNGELKEIVEAKGLTKYFTMILGSEKPKIDRLDQILAREDVQPDNVLFVGDALSDYGAAAEKKTFFIGRIQPGGKNVFPPENTLAIINDLTELSSYLENN